MFKSCIDCKIHKRECDFYNALSIKCKTCSKVNVKKRYVKKKKNNLTLEELNKQFNKMKYEFYILQDNINAQMNKINNSIELLVIRLNLD